MSFSVGPLQALSLRRPASFKTAAADATAAAFRAIVQCSNLFFRGNSLQVPPLPTLAPLPRGG
jgi:hypothetical protein